MINSQQSFSFTTICITILMLNSTSSICMISFKSFRRTVTKPANRKIEERGQIIKQETESVSVNLKHHNYAHAPCSPLEYYSLLLA